MTRRERIEGAGLTLVPMTAEQAQSLRAGELSDLPAGPGWPHADTLDGVGAALAGGDPEALPWLVVVDDGSVVGDVGWKGAPSPDGEVEIGYGLAAPSRGLGLGTEAVRRLIGWLALQPAVRRVVAQTTVDNEPSRRLLVGLGFHVTAEHDRDVWYALDLTR